MPVEPAIWNAVVIGAWNRAILTPDGIRRRLFELPEGSPIEIEVAVDLPGQFRVVHDGLIVISGSNRLEVAARTASDRARLRALSSGFGLAAETPVSAVGVNIRYRLTEVPDPVIDLVRAPIDEALSDAGHQVVTSTTKRSSVLASDQVQMTLFANNDHGTASMIKSV